MTQIFICFQMCRPMFKSGLKQQGKFLVRMMTQVLSIFGDDMKFVETLVKLTESHNERGVKAVECKYSMY